MLLQMEGFHSLLWLNNFIIFQIDNTFTLLRNIKMCLVENSLPPCVWFLFSAPQQATISFVHQCYALDYDALLCKYKKM